MSWLRGLAIWRIGTTEDSFVSMEEISTMIELQSFDIISKYESKNNRELKKDNIKLKTNESFLYIFIIIELQLFIYQKIQVTLTI